MNVREQLFLVGHPVSHSKSPAMYNAAYQELGLNWHYGLRDFPTEDDARAFLTERHYLSLNITTPYKPLAFDVAEVKAASAQLAGGANLLVLQKGKLLGFNTDGQGCTAFLRRSKVALYGKKAVVCGTGPTALAILHDLALCGVNALVLLSRNKGRAASVLRRYASQFQRLAFGPVSLPSQDGGHLSFREAYDRVQLKYGAYDTSRQAIAEADLIVDATSLGMGKDDPAPFDTNLLSKGQTVLDVVYGHGETALIHGARKVGCKAYDGAGMLVGQAVVTVGILCDVKSIDCPLSESALFDMMAKAAGFALESPSTAEALQ